MLVLVFLVVNFVVIIVDVFGDFFGVFCYEMVVFVVDGGVFIFFNGIYCLVGVIVVDYMKIFVLVFI